MKVISTEFDFILYCYRINFLFSDNSALKPKTSSTLPLRTSTQVSQQGCSQTKFKRDQILKWRHQFKGAHSREDFLTIKKPH